MSDTLPECLTSYRTHSRIPVQWGDLDAFGHVNNVVYIRWLETARIDLLDTYPSSVTMAAGGIGPILASIHCDYRKQLHYPDDVLVGSRCGRIGRTSIDVEHAIYSVSQQHVVATGISVLVVFDYDANRPVRVPDDLRTQIADS